MHADLLHLLYGHLLLLGLSIGFALALDEIRRRHRSPGLDAWVTSWWTCAVAAGLGALAVGVATFAGGVVMGPAVGILALAEGAVVTQGVLLLLGGTRSSGEVDHRVSSRSSLAWAVAGAVVALVAAVWALPDFATGGLRGLARLVEMRALPMAWLVVLCARGIGVAAGREGGRGALFLRVALVGYAIHQLAHLAVASFSGLPAEAVSSFFLLTESLPVGGVGLMMTFFVLGEERRQVLERVDRTELLSRHDPVSGLLNRRAFLEGLERFLSRRRPEESWGLIVIAIERFKALASVFGEATAEEVVTLLAGRLEAAAAERDVLARNGDDEFALLVRTPTDEELLANRAATLLAIRERAFRVGDREIYLRLIAGSYVDRGGDVGASEALQHARAALHHAEAVESRPHAVYRPQLGARSEKRLEIESRLQRAWREREFCLHFQPTFRLERERIVGVEALLRWRHPEEGIVLPGGFLGTLRATGMMTQLENWVLREAIDSLEEWQREGLTGLRMAINLSAQRFSDPTLVRLLESLLDEHSVDPKQIELEITETAALSMAAGPLETLARVKELGVRIAIDDFGAGYSSFAYLGFLPADTLKIDRSLVTGLGEREESQRIVGSIVALAKGLGLEVVAEGVENAHQVGVLTDLRCDLAQGFHLGEPRGAIETYALLASHTGGRPAAGP